VNRITIIEKAWEIISETKNKFPEYKEKLSSIYVMPNTRLRAVAGRADTNHNTIELSTQIFSMPENHSGFRNTVLHEIAHLLHGEKGHKAGWRKVFKKIGGNGKRCHSFNVTTRQKTVYCTQCMEEIKVGDKIFEKIINGIAYQHKNCCFGSLQPTNVLTLKNLYKKKHNLSCKQ